MPAITTDFDEFPQEMHRLLNRCVKKPGNSILWHHNHQIRITCITSCVNTIPLEICDACCVLCGWGLNFDVEQSHLHGGMLVIQRQEQLLAIQNITALFWQHFRTYCLHVNLLILLGHKSCKIALGTGGVGWAKNGVPRVPQLSRRRRLKVIRRECSRHDPPAFLCQKALEIHFRQIHTRDISCNGQPHVPISTLSPFLLTLPQRKGRARPTVRHVTI